MFAVYGVSLGTGCGLRFFFFVRVGLADGVSLVAKDLRCMLTARFIVPPPGREQWETFTCKAVCIAEGVQRVVKVGICTR